ncbi:19639_t:CDS:2, partial [Gigaspora rosea]
FCVDDSYEEFQMCLTYPYKNSVESGDNTAVDLNENLIMTSFYVDSNEEFQTYSIVKGNNYAAVECFDVDNNEEFKRTVLWKGIIKCFDIDNDEFQMYSVVEGNNNAAVECNENPMTSFHVDNNEEFQTYLSESALESDDNTAIECFYADSYEEFQTYLSKGVENYDNATVECNDNPSEHNNNSEEDYDENFVNNQSFYTELLQEGIESPNTTYDDTINIKCSFSGKSISNQVIDPTQQRQWPSRKIRCPWHINLTNPKSLSEVGITSIVGQHNHPMVPDITLYAPKYRRLSNEIMDQIKFYITKGNMVSKQIYSLLVTSFPDQIIGKQDLYNAIQKFKAPLTKCQGDAQYMVNKLLDLQKKKADWIIKTRLDPFDN